jgi:hypothetical protein
MLGDASAGLSDDGVHADGIKAGSANPIAAKAHLAREIESGVRSARMSARIIPALSTTGKYPPDRPCAAGEHANGIRPPPRLRVSSRPKPVGSRIQWLFPPVAPCAAP